MHLRPNVPGVPRARQQARRELGAYYVQIENLDWKVGRLCRALVELGLAQDTYVLFFSDHRDMHSSRGQFRKAAPWEQAVRASFVLYRWGGWYGHRHGVQDVLLNHVDIAPTSLGLCGIDPPDRARGSDYCCRFVTQHPLGEEPDSAFLQLVVPTGHADSVDRPWRGLITQDGWKYVCLEGQRWLMFNLTDDPFELADLAHSTRFRAERRRLNGRLARWVADTGDAFGLPKLWMLRARRRLKGGRQKPILWLLCPAARSVGRPMYR
jgi:arylsulfatase A-like enzyme